MASATLTPSHARFGASFSGNLSRPEFHQTEGFSMADQLPSINFGFDDLRERMMQFTARFDEFIERGRKRVLEERNHFRLNVAEIQESQRARKRDIDAVKDKISQHEIGVEKELQEQEEMHQAIDELSSRKEDHLARRDDLKAQIAEVQNAITKRRQAQLQHQKQLDGQARHNGPELQFWEASLCLRIDGTGSEDHLKFIFTHVDEKHWETECWFELSMATSEYDVLGTQPVLEKDSLQAVLERLNESRELAPFLKAMRCLFVAAVRA